LSENGLSIYPAHYDDSSRTWPNTREDIRRMVESINFEK
jgi:hypothetical protein